MRTVNVADAKKHLSDLLGRVAFGRERVVISRRGKPMAMLVPVGNDTEAHLAQAKGWLDADDPFFEAIDRVIAGRGAEFLRDPGLEP